MTLEEFFCEVPKAAVAFSGGTDSAFLLWAAKQYGCDVHAYYMKTAFQPEFEMEDARRVVEALDIPMTVLEKDILAVPEAAANGPKRCYYCKRALFTQLWAAALQMTVRVCRRFGNLRYVHPFGNVEFPKAKSGVCPKKQGSLQAENRLTPVWQQGFRQEQPLHRNF